MQKQIKYLFTFIILLSLNNSFSQISPKKIAPKKVVYVSCNSATQARDLALMDEKYKVTRVRPVDMFPQTHHVENDVLLELR